MNLQNIPSHDTLVRMMFKAADDTHLLPPEEDNIYLIPITDQVQLKDGWKYARDLVRGDLILTEDNTLYRVISNVLNGKYYMVEISPN